MAKEQPLVGTIVDSRGKARLPTEPVSAQLARGIVEVAGFAVEVVNGLSQERQKRAQIQAERDVEVARIRTAENEAARKHRAEYELRGRQERELAQMLGDPQVRSNPELLAQVLSAYVQLGHS